MKYLIMIMLMIAPLASYAGGSLALTGGTSLSGDSGTLYGVEAKYADRGFYGALGYTSGMDWKTVTQDGWVKTTKEGEIKTIAATVGLIQAVGPLSLHAGGGYSYNDYGDKTDYDPHAVDGAEYSITDNISVGAEVKRGWTDRIGTVDVAQATLRYSF